MTEEGWGFHGASEAPSRPWVFRGGLRMGRRHAKGCGNLVLNAPRAALHVIHGIKHTYDDGGAAARAVTGSPRPPDGETAGPRVGDVARRQCGCVNMLGKLQAALMG